MDIRFYGKDFKLRHILPGYSKTKTAISTNRRFDFNGDGYFELDFKDDELQALVLSEPELLIVCGKFQGFLTGYNFTESPKKLFGMHLNGLLAREVVDDLTDIGAADVETLIYNKFAEMQAAGRLSWLELKEKKGTFTNQIEFFKNSCVKAHTWVQELLDTDSAGYKISADMTEGTFYFEVLPQTTTDLIISESLGNAYDVVIDYNRKEYANGGFYKDEEGAWHYIQLTDAVGLERNDTVLNATTEADARRELEATASLSTLSALTKKLTFGTDYQLGDIIRLQTKYGTARKAVSAVFVSDEGGKHVESPTFKEIT